jgi:hypothetical protein
MSIMNSVSSLSDRIINGYNETKEEKATEFSSASSKNSFHGKKKIQF